MWERYVGWIMDIKFSRVKHWKILIKRQSCHYIETSQLISRANQLTGFCKMSTLGFDEVRLCLISVYAIISYKLTLSCMILKKAQKSTSITSFRYLLFWTLNKCNFDLVIYFVARILLLCVFLIFVMRFPFFVI